MEGFGFFASTTVTATGRRTEAFEISTPSPPLAVIVPLTVTRFTRGDVPASQTEEAKAGDLAIYDTFQRVEDNAGTVVRKPFAELNDEDWRHVVAVNLDAAFYVTRAFTADLVARRRGAGDLRETGDGNPGFWNARETLGRRAAVPVFVGDVAEAIGRAAAS